MTTRVIAIRELVQSGPADEKQRDHKRWSGTGAVRFAAWLAALGAGGFLLRRAIRRRHRIDPGAVSDDWLAQHRDPPSDPIHG